VAPGLACGQRAHLGHDVFGIHRHVLVIGFARLRVGVAFDADHPKAPVLARDEQR
jgi:hypothetical protein